MCRCKNGHQKQIYLKEVGLRAQNMFTILCSIVNIILHWGGGGGGGGPFNVHKKFLFDRE